MMWIILHFMGCLMGQSVMRCYTYLESMKKTCWGPKGVWGEGKAELGAPVVKFCNNGFSGHKSWRKAR